MRHDENIGQASDQASGRWAGPAPARAATYPARRHPASAAANESFGSAARASADPASGIIVSAAPCRRRAKRVAKTEHERPGRRGRSNSKARTANGSTAGPAPTRTEPGGPHRGEHPPRSLTVRLAGSGRPEEHHVLPGGDEVQGAQVRDDLAAQPAGVVEVELFQALAGGEPRGRRPGRSSPRPRRALPRDPNSGSASVTPPSNSTAKTWSTISSSTGGHDGSRITDKRRQTCQS